MVRTTQLATGETTVKPKPPLRREISARDVCVGMEVKLHNRWATVQSITDAPSPEGLVRWLDQAAQKLRDGRVEEGVRGLMWIERYAFAVPDYRPGRLRITCGNRGGSKNVMPNELIPVRS